MKQLLPFVRNRDSHKLYNIDYYEKFGFVTTTGHHILDGQAAVYSFSLGYQNEEILNYIHQESIKVPYVRANKYVTTDSVLKLQKEWSDLSNGHLTHVFYGLGGSDSLDSATKMALHYWKCKSDTQKKNVITFDDSYHGSTVASTFLCGMTKMNSQFQTAKQDWIYHTPQPYFNGDATDEQKKKQEDYCIEKLKQLIKNIGPESIAAIVKEPLTLFGGIIKCSTEYNQAIRKICDENDILLIVDDVATCGGKLGKYFGYQTMGILPDIVTTAKSLTAGFAQLSGTFCNKKVGDVIEKEPFLNGWTFSPAMPGIYSALKSIEIIKRENILSNVTLIENKIIQCSENLKKQNKIKGYRVFGTFASLELNDGVDPDVARVRAWKNGVILGSEMVQGNPLFQLVLPINIDDDTIEQMFYRIGLGL